LVILNYPNYVYKGWHVTLIGYATILIPLAFNIFARKTLKPIEIIGAVLHTIFFIVFVVVLICLGGRNSATFVFTEDSGGISGWTNPGAQWCIGLLSAVFPLTAFDGVLHLSKRSNDRDTDPANASQAMRSRTQKPASHGAW
jgi:choline transport protein